MSRKEPHASTHNAGGSDAIADPTWKPVDYSFITWTFDAALIASSQAPSASGTAQTALLKVPAATTITQIFMNVGTAGAGFTAGQNFAALYQNGNLLAATADQAAAWASAGTKAMALTTAQPVTAGLVRVIFWANASTLPLFGRAANSPSVNAGLPGTGLRFATANAGLTTAAPATLGALSAQNASWWAALS